MSEYAVKSREQGCTTTGGVPGMDTAQNYTLNYESKHPNWTPLGEVQLSGIDYTRTNATEKSVHELHQLRRLADVWVPILRRGALGLRRYMCRGGAEESKHVSNTPCTGVGRFCRQNQGPRNQKIGPAKMQEQHTPVVASDYRSKNTVFLRCLRLGGGGGRR